MADGLAQQPPPLIAARRSMWPAHHLPRPVVGCEAVRSLIKQLESAADLQRWDLSRVLTVARKEALSR